MAYKVESPHRTSQLGSSREPRLHGVRLWPGWMGWVEWAGTGHQEHGSFMLLAFWDIRFGLPVCLSRWALADSGWGELLRRGAARGWSQPRAVVGCLCGRWAGCSRETEGG